MKSAVAVYGTGSSAANLYTLWLVSLIIHYMFVLVEIVFVAPYLTN